MTKARMHSFWVLPNGLNHLADQVLEERIRNWGIVPVGTGNAVEETSELTKFLRDYCNAKEYAAIHVNNRMMLESFQTFLSVKTMTEGFLPDWGLRQDSIAVIPVGELPEMIGILSTLPPYAAWKRLRELCIEAQKQGKHVLYRGLLNESQGETEAPIQDTEQ